MAVIDVVCPHRGSIDGVVKNGKADSELQRYLCRHCKRSFQLDFIYNANKPGTHDQIMNMTMNGSRVRDTGRVPGICPTTGISHLKKLAPPNVTSQSFKREKQVLIYQMD